MRTTRTISTLLTASLFVALTACGGSDGTSGGEEPAAADELGGMGHWTSAQICALSTADAVSTQFGVEVEEGPSVDEADQSGCAWRIAGEPAAQAAMRISNRGGFASDGLGRDEVLDIAGADLAGYSDNVGGAASVAVVVGDQLLEITFPVGTEGAREFGTVIATTWVASQT